MGLRVFHREFGGMPHIGFPCCRPADIGETIFRVFSGRRRIVNHHIFKAGGKSS